VVNTVHGLYATPEDGALKRAAVLGVERVAARFSDLELYQSREDLEWVRRLGIVRPERSALLGNGIDLSVFDPSRVPPERIRRLRAELGIQPDARVVGTVGRLVEEKGYLEFFAAARAIRAEQPDVRFLAVGAPDDAKSDVIGPGEIEAASPNVVVTGWREDVRDLLALMDVFVLASWREGLPRSAIEAAAMGKPLILTDVRGCREVVRDGIDGILVPPRQPAELTAAILRMLQDAELRMRTGRAARAGALERWDERRVAESILTSYRALTATGLRAVNGSRNGGAPSANGTVRVREAARGDAPAMAALHRAGLPDAFLPTLGDAFLRRLYRAVIEDRQAVAVVAENGHGVVGFATGVRSVKSFYRRFFIRHGLTAGVAAAPKLLKVSSLRRIDETARYLRTMRRLPEAELLSIAVAPDHRQRGVASSLARAVASGLADRGVAEMKVVVASENAPANRFYRRLGFRHVGSLSVHEGRQSAVWVIECRS
jgi:ribosomal protein S18 acetylase RimI-like enzyme